MSDSNKIVLIDLSNLPDAVAKMVCRLMDMLEHAAGYVAPSRVARDAKHKAEATIIEEISNNTNLDPVERLAAISNLKKYVKEYKNQTKIVADAIPFLKADAKPEEVNEDWISTFMDKARLVSSEELQLIWSELLAQETNEPGSVSKQLLHILMQMSKDDADRFNKFIPLCVDILEGKLLHEIVPMVADCDEDLKKHTAITYDDISVLESFGLVKYNRLKTVYVKSDKELKVMYGGNLVRKVEPNHNLWLGSVVFTKAGRELLGVCERIYTEEMFQYVCMTTALINNEDRIE